MHLWDLAPELLIQILRFTDPSTFYILTQSVVPFLSEATASSKSLLLYQLGALPGLKQGLEGLTTQELFHCFQERAAKSLCGVDALAVVTLFNFGFSNFDIRQSMFYPQFIGADCLFMVHRDEPCISTFALSLSGGPPRLKGIVDLRKEYESEEFCKLKVTRIAVSPSGMRWAIFYSCESVMAEAPTTFAKERLEGQVVPTLLHRSFKLAIVDQEGDMYHLILLDVGGVHHSDPYQLVGLAISDDEHVAISRRFSLRRKSYSEIMVYRGRSKTHCSIGKFRADRAPDGLKSRFLCPQAISSNILEVKECFLFTRNAGLCEMPAKLTYTSGNFVNVYSDRVPIHDIQFTFDGTQLLFFAPTSSIHYMYLDHTDEADDPIILNHTLVGGFEGYRNQRSMHIGMPFYMSHTTREQNNGNWVEKVCADAWLSIGTESNMLSQDAYIVRSTRLLPFASCNCVPDLDSGRRRYGWDVLVQLKGFLWSSSSLGPVVAISKDSDRLAVADWKRIRIWPLDPEGLVQNEVDYYRRINRQSDFEIGSGVGVIEPFELPTNGDVIHKLFFASSDILYAVTDRGMTMWNLIHHVDWEPSGEWAVLTGGLATKESNIFPAEPKNKFELDHGACIFTSPRFRVNRVSISFS